MQAFAYQAKDSGGRSHGGVIEARNADEAAGFLLRRGLNPTDISHKGQGARLRLIARHRVGGDDLVVFARSLATLVRSGLSLPVVMKLLEGAAPSPGVAWMCRRVGQELGGGASFSQALAQCGISFPLGFSDAVRAGEEAGTLPEVLERMAGLLELERERRSRLKAALRYPAMVMVALLVAGGLVGGVVIPRMAEFYGTGGVNLPLPTAILLGTFETVCGHWLELLLGGGALAGLAWTLLRRPSGRRWLEALSWRLPIWGRLKTISFASQFCHFFATFYAAGVSVERILEILADAWHRSAVGRELEAARWGVEAGGSIGQGLRASRYFPSMLVQMVKLGEETAALEPLLRSGGSYFDLESDNLTKRAISYLEPITTVAVAGLILFLALATLLPLWDLISVYRH